MWVWGREADKQIESRRKKLGQTLTLAVGKLCHTLGVKQSAICGCIHPPMTKQIPGGGDYIWVMWGGCSSYPGPLWSKNPTCLDWSKTGCAVDLGTKAYSGLKRQRPQVAPGELLVTTEEKERSFSPVDQCAQQPECCPFHSAWHKQKQADAIYHLPSNRKCKDHTALPRNGRV